MISPLGNPSRLRRGAASYRASDLVPWRRAAVGPYSAGCLIWPLCQAKAKVSLILGTSLLGKARAGDNGALGMLARNHWGWDRPGATTMALSVPSANGDIGDDNKIIIEMVRARKRDENGDFIE